VTDLVVLGFDRRRDAEEVFELGAQLHGKALVDLEDAALAWRDDKVRVRIHQALPTVATGASTGSFACALWGTLIGLLVLNPLAGMAVGGLAGAAAGALSDIGISDDLIRRIGEQLQPGKAAVFAMDAGPIPLPTPCYSGCHHHSQRRDTCRALGNPHCPGRRCAAAHPLTAVAIPALPTRPTLCRTSATINALLITSESPVGLSNDITQSGRAYGSIVPDPSSGHGRLAPAAVGWSVP
jgi:uncharacterized membrane protein